MALDLERPTAAMPTSCRSSSPPDQRSPQEQRSSHSSIPPSSLKFSIEKILSADFGRRDIRDIPIEKEKAPTPPPRNENSPIAGARAMNQANPLLYPAWIYCSRISDRPSSGKFAIKYLQHNFILRDTISLRCSEVLDGKSFS